MNDVPAIAWIALVILTAQAVVMVYAPQRAAALMLWQYKLIGIQPAQPGRATLFFFRAAGIVMLAIAAYILIQVVSE